MKKLTKKQKQTFFFLFPILLILLFLVSSIFWAPQTVTRTWLTISIGEFDDNVNDGVKPLTQTIGGYDLLSFQEFDSELIAPDTVVYNSEAVFGWEFLQYTNLLKEDTFVGLNTQSITNHRYLHYTEWNWDIFQGNYKVFNQDMYATYRECTWNYIANYDYDGSTQINMSINSDISGLIGQEIAGVTIEGAEMLYQFTETRRVNIEKGICGDYNDEFVKIGPSEGRVSVVTIEDDGATGHTVSDGTFTALGLGWDVAEEGEWIMGSGQNSIHEAVEYTGHYDTSGEISFDLQRRLRPEIMVREQNIVITDGSIAYHRFGEYVWDLYTSTVGVPLNLRRTTAVKTTNVYIHEEFETTVRFVATVKYDHELTQTELDDPFFFQGDYIWDEGMEGSSDVTIVDRTTPFEDFISGLFGGANWIVNLVILIAVVYITIKAIPIIKTVVSRKRGV